MLEYVKELWKITWHLPGFCFATAENAIGAVGRIVDGDWILFWANIWAADGWFLLGVELINGLEIEFCEAATEAADVMMLLLLLSDSSADVFNADGVVGGIELLVSILARTAVGFTGW